MCKVFYAPINKPPGFESGGGLLVLFRRHTARQNELAAQGPALRRRSGQSIIMTTTNLQANARPGVDAAQQKCLVCDKEIGDGAWFCKIPRKEKPTAVLCCPGCALRYFDSLHPTTNGDELDRAVGERSLHFLVNGET